MLIDAGEENHAQTRRLLPRIFVAALAIRWVYAIVLYLFMGDRGLMSEDSVTYLYAANEFLTAISAGKVHGLDWFGLDPWFMPLFYWLITLHLMVFGTLATLSYVLMQGVLDAATCVVIYYIAFEVHPRYARGAAICAVINPTQIVLSGIFFTDTPFLFFTSLMLLGALRWLNQPSGRAAALLAIGLCGAFLIRVVMAPWAATLIPALLIASKIRGTLSAKQAVRMCMVAAVVAVFVGGVAARNAMQFGAFSLTPQGGHHLALWVLPLVKEAQDRTPWAETNSQVKLQRQKMFGDPPHNQFRLESQYRVVAGPELEKLSPTSFAKAWATGIALSLASPGILISPPIYYLPRTGFFATAGASLFEKCINFLFYSGSSIHAFAALFGLIGLALVRVLQLIGIVAILRRRENLWPAALLAGWVGYILLINGPIASPKYRLPIEPVLMIACGAGLLALRRKSSAV
jgi:4-amino-4-deoxy-L-arabinose transferase-like glycosyltransferase